LDRARQIVENVEGGPEGLVLESFHLGDNLAEEMVNYSLKMAGESLFYVKEGRTPNEKKLVALVMRNKDGLIDLFSGRLQNAINEVTAQRQRARNLHSLQKCF